MRLEQRNNEIRRRFAINVCIHKPESNLHTSSFSLKSRWLPDSSFRVAHLTKPDKLSLLGPAIFLVLDRQLHNPLPIDSRLYNLSR